MNRWQRLAFRLRYAGPRKAGKAVWSRAERKLGLAGSAGPVEPVDPDAFFPSSLGVRHVFDDPVATAALVQERFPDKAAATVRVADAIRAHRFHFLGRDVAFGPSINWMWCPETGGSWPVLEPGGDEKVHFGEQRPGDIKYPWELNRHQYFTTLAKAYLYTGDEGYVSEIAAQMVDWRRANPFGMGHNWLSALELGIRIISWSNALWLCRDSATFRREGMQACLTGLYEHARALSGKLTTYWLLRNNHLIGEAAGLFVFAVLFPDLPESAGWQRQALRVLETEYRDQVFRDGVNVEQATGYHRFITEFLVLVVALADRNDVTLPPVLRERLGAMVAYERAITAPDGTVPQIGDCDDGRAWLLSETVPFDEYGGVVTIGAALLGRSDLALGATEETLWLLGEKKWTDFEQRGATPRATGSDLFRDGGHCVMRRGPWYVLTRCGPFGLGEDGGSLHSHSDILAPVLYCNGSPFAVDAGTYGYLCATEDRLLFRSALAHNTLTPDGVNQGELDDIWNWGLVPKSRVTAWSDSADETSLTGTLRSPCGFVHTRTLRVPSNGSQFVIEDELDLQSPVDGLSWRLHLAPGLEARVSGSGPIIGIYRGSVPIAELSYGGFDGARVESAWYSPVYGVRTGIERIVLSGHGSAFRGRVTLEALQPGDQSV